MKSSGRVVTAVESKNGGFGKSFFEAKATFKAKPGALPSKVLEGAEALTNLERLAFPELVSDIFEANASNPAGVTCTTL